MKIFGSNFEINKTLVFHLIDYKRIMGAISNYNS